jgi:hypothetical protein
MGQWGRLTESKSFHWWTPLGATEEEALAKVRASGVSEWSLPPLAVLKEQANVFRVPKHRPKPEGVPLTKTEEKRKLAKEKARAKAEAYPAKHSYKIEIA